MSSHDRPSDERTISKITGLRVVQIGEGTVSGGVVYPGCELVDEPVGIAVSIATTRKRGCGILT